MNPQGRTLSSPMMEEEHHLVSAPFLFHGSFQGTGRLTFFYYFPEKRTYCLLVELITFLESPAIRREEFVITFVQSQKVGRTYVFLFQPNVPFI